jgi:hypothetical protein
MTDFNILLSHPIRVAQRHSERVAKFLGFSSHQGAKSMSKSVKSQPESNPPKPEMVRIVVYGIRPGVDQIVRELFLCRFSEQIEWSSPQPVPNSPNEVMITYTRRLR